MQTLERLGWALQVSNQSGPPRSISGVFCR